MPRLASQAAGSLALGVHDEGVRHLVVADLALVVPQRREVVDEREGAAGHPAGDTDEALDPSGRFGRNGCLGVGLHRCAWASEGLVAGVGLEPTTFGL